MEQELKSPFLQPPIRDGRLALSNRRILCVTGLPCIGKTRVLQHICSRVGLRFVNFDEVRNSCMPRPMYGEAADGFEGSFSGFPLSIAEWGSLLGSAERFLAFYAWQARKFGVEVMTHLEGDSSVVLEISPFVLRDLKINAPVLFCSVERFFHIKRLQSRLGCQIKQARAIHGFFANALSDAGGVPKNWRAIDLHALPSELTRSEETACGA